MNPRIPTDYHETAAWLTGFVRSHAKRENARIETLVDATGSREGRSYGIGLSLDGQTLPPPGSPPIELDFREVAEGRTSFGGARRSAIVSGLLPGSCPARSDPSADCGTAAGSRALPARRSATDMGSAGARGR